MTVTTAVSNDIIAHTGGWRYSAVIERALA